MPQPEAAVPAAGHIPPTFAAPTPPVSPIAAPRLTRSEHAGIVFEGVAFDARSHRLVVIDQAGGPGTRFADAAAAGSSVPGGIAAVNGGFFTPTGEALGLVIADGTVTGAWNAASSLGSAVWHEDASGRSAISRRGKLGRQAALGMRELLQAGPLLVENGHAVGGLENTKTSARTLILWDGGQRWWIGRTPPCTLANLAAALAASQPAGWSAQHALNLDGGRSADLWVSDAVSGGPLSRRPPWNRPVRNFLVLRPR